MNNKSVKIDYDLFIKLIKYFLFDIDYSDDIRKGLNDKLDKLALHEYYSQYKDKTLSEQEREQARQKYLDGVGISQSFRW